MKAEELIDKVLQTEGDSAAIQRYYYYDRKKVNEATTFAPGERAFMDKLARRYKGKVSDHSPNLYVFHSSKMAKNFYRDMLAEPSDEEMDGYDVDRPKLGFAYGTPMWGVMIR